MNDPAEFVVFTFGARLRLRAGNRLLDLLLCLRHFFTSRLDLDVCSLVSPKHLLKSNHGKSPSPIALWKMWTQTFAHNRIEGEMRAAHLNVRHFPQQRPIGPVFFPPHPKFSVPNLLLRFWNGTCWKSFPRKRPGFPAFGWYIYNARCEIPVLNAFCVKAGAILFR